VITGAAGNLGGKLRRALDGRCELRLLDRDPRGDPTIHAVDLSRWDDAWVRLFVGADAVVHLAADPGASRSWEELIAPNMDALIHAYEAAARGGVKRFVFASSNHVMGGYKDVPDVLITPELPPLPGSHYTTGGEPRDSTPYGAAKLFGERLGACYAARGIMTVLAVRIGWVWAGKNRPADLPADREAWFRQMWLSDRDFVRLMLGCLSALGLPPFAVVNGMSDNTGSRWDLTATRQLLGYEPLDDVSRSTGDEPWEM
jgi:nucleoside-diphosphate-sugar epimerase